MRMLLMIALLPLAACESNAERADKAGTAQPSGPRGTRSFAASGFTGVDVRSADDVDVETGTTFAVTADGDIRTLDLLDIRVENGILRVDRKNSTRNERNIDSGARIHVVMPRLNSAKVSSSGDLDIERAEGDFTGAIAGSGNLGVGDLRATNVQLSLAGSGDMRVAGSASKLTASVAGSGNIDAKRLIAASADVSIAGSGDVYGTVKGPASVSIVGSGNAELGGGAKCSVSAIGSGEAHCS